MLNHAEKKQLTLAVLKKELDEKEEMNPKKYGFKNFKDLIGMTYSFLIIENLNWYGVYMHVNAETNQPYVTLIPN
jgi:hypothetical protein